MDINYYHLFLLAVSAILLVIWFIAKKKMSVATREKLCKFLASSPIIKSMLFIITVVATGILCSSFVTEINTTDGLQWTHSLECDSFYWLIMVIVIDFIYNWLTYSNDAEILKFADDKFIIAYVRMHSIDAYVKKINKGIDAAPDIIPFDPNSKIF